MQPETIRRSPAPGSWFRSLPGRALIAWTLFLGAGSALMGGEPAPSDALLKLVPADAALIVTGDHLRDHARSVLDSRLFERVQGLPAFRAWLDSEKVQAFERSRAQIEAFLDTSFQEVRDEVLGDAVVLVLRLSAEKPADPAEARGLLLLKARDPKLIKRLVNKINATQQQNGEIAELSEQTRGETVYHTRTFHPGDDHMPESFVIFPDGTFAFSNAESLIHEVIDRKTAKTEVSTNSSVADRAGFKATAARLPSEAAVRLFVEPAAARRLLGGLSEPAKDEDRRMKAILDRYVGGLDYVGAALVIRDHEIKFQAVQAILADRFRELVGAWTSDRTNRPGSRLLIVPASTIALASLNFDFPSLYRVLKGLVPADEQPRIAKLETLAEGLCLGLDVHRQILPALGPRVVAAIEPPDFSAPADAAAPRGFPFPLIVAAEIDEEAVPRQRGQASPTVAAALDNALKTVLTAIALDEKRVPASTHIEDRAIDGSIVRSLSTPYPFAFAVDRPGRRLVLGTSAMTVARYLDAGADPKAGSRFQQIQSVSFPDSESYVCLDLAAIHDLAVKHRERLIEATAKKENRSAADVGRDLDQVLGLVHLFDAAFLSIRADAENAVLEQTVGVLPNPAPDDH